MIATERLYPIRRPLAALLAGASVALLGGLIGLGGAEFRLPLLIAVFALYPHRAIRINLLITFAKQRGRIEGSYSITSSARASSDGGMVRPSEFAAFTLITSSNFVA